MKALIFGANGQDGYYLNKLLSGKNIEVAGSSRSGPWINGDVADFKFVSQLIRDHQPAYIFHLAANSTTAHAAWLENHKTICDGTLNILENVKTICPDAKVFISGSGLQFENQGLPIKETDPFVAGSPYAVSRIHSVYAARYYPSLGIKAYVGYFFNHESPLRSERHMSKKIAAFARRIANGSSETLAIGDITVKKEWAYADDIVSGIWTLISQDRVFEAVIGSGKAYSIAEWLDECFGMNGKDWRPYITIQPGFTPEYNCLVSNPETLTGLGWHPRVSFQELAHIMMKED